MASVDELMGQLADSTKLLTKSQLVDLSDMPSSEAKRFKELWQGLGSVRRRHLIAQMTTEAGENVQLNFGSIFTSCLGDPDEVVRTKAIEGLWECQEPGLIGILTSLLKDDTSKSVRKAAAKALGVFVLLAEWGKIQQHYGEQLETALLNVIKDNAQDLEIRQRALESVSYFSHQEIVEIINEAYNGEEQPMKISALRAMGRNLDLKWLTILLKELSNPKAEMRLEATRAYGEMGDEKAVIKLIERSEDEDSGVQLAAIQSLGRIGGTRAIRALRDMLKHPEPKVREAAREALQEAQFSTDSISLAL